MPWRGELEHAVVSQLVADRKVVIRKGSYHDNDVVVNINAVPYEEEHGPDYIEPLVVHLALDNPRNEELAKVFRSNYAVPTLPILVADPHEVAEIPAGWDYV